MCTQVVVVAGRIVLVELGNERRRGEMIGRFLATPIVIQIRVVTRIALETHVETIRFRVSRVSTRHSTMGLRATCEEMMSFRLATFAANVAVVIVIVHAMFVVARERSTAVSNSSRILVRRVLVGRRMRAIQLLQRLTIGLRTIVRTTERFDVHVGETRVAM